MIRFELLREEKFEMGNQAESWGEYSARVLMKWHSLLSVDSSESEIQSFLESHPLMLLATYNKHHTPLFRSLFTQPLLPGFNSKRPDFMWLATDSECVSPILIEIEKPSKKWFTKKGVPTADFTQATNQLTQWKEWFSNPENRTIFRKGYRLDEKGLRSKTRILEPHYVLLYGRREEVANKESIRRASARPDTTIMTFDRLELLEKFGNCIICINNKFEVLTFPSVAQIGPNVVWEEWDMLSGLELAIKNSNDISIERKKFLCQRITYWKERDKMPLSSLKNPFHKVGDWE